MPRALVKYPQGNLEEIQQKTLQSTQVEPGDRQDHKAQAYATERYVASRALLAQAQARQYVRCSGNVSAQTPSWEGERTYVRFLGQPKGL